ncbi:hypothetical protein Q7F20_07585 [Curtobacterium sp. A7_M15]|uniref:hypothetical protein n=1 Tax=Curtobacterium sp. A7_M15 TaxID=3065241 RepID=UPI0027379B95|nr:hypothetical protein [Curtobacterium sp. A7_M15]MDP4333230.1 hypothetical protein [Curtobacterium sp. A7_M15]
MPRRKVAEQYRRWVTDRLKPLLPRRWTLSPYTRKPDELSGPTVIVTLQKIQRLPDAPLGAQVATYLVTVVDPATDWAQADKNLDDEIVDLIAGLDSVRNDDGLPVLRWITADRNTWNDTYLAFDITVEVIITATPKE